MVETVVDVASVVAVVMVDDTVVDGASVDDDVVEATVVVGISCSANVVEVASQPSRRLVLDVVDLSGSGQSRSVVVGRGMVDGASGPGPVLTVEISSVVASVVAGIDSTLSVVGTVVTPAAIVVDAAELVGQVSLELGVGSGSGVVGGASVVVVSAGDEAVAGGAVEPSPSRSPEGAAVLSAVPGSAWNAWIASGPATTATDSIERINAKAKRDVKSDRRVGGADGDGRLGDFMVAGTVLWGAE